MYIFACQPIEEVEIEAHFASPRISYCTKNWCSLLNLLPAGVNQGWEPASLDARASSNKQFQDSASVFVPTCTPALNTFKEERHARLVILYLLISFVCPSRGYKVDRIRLRPRCLLRVFGVSAILPICHGNSW